MQNVPKPFARQAFSLCIAALMLTFTSAPNAQAKSRKAMEATERAIAVVNERCGASAVQKDLSVPRANEPAWMQTMDDAPASSERANLVDWATNKQGRICERLRGCVQVMDLDSGSARDPKGAATQQVAALGTCMQYVWQLELGDLSKWDSEGYTLSNAFGRKYKEIDRSGDASRVDELRAPLSDLWFSRRVFLNLLDLNASLPYDVLRAAEPNVQSGYDSLKAEMQAQRTRSLKSWDEHWTPTVSNTDYNDLAKKFADRREEAQRDSDRRALCDGDVGGVSMVWTANECLAALSLDDSALPSAIEPILQKCTSITEAGASAIEAAIKGACYNESQSSRLQIVVDSWRGTPSTPLGAGFSTLRDRFALASKSAQTCTKLAQPLAKKETVLSWKRCMADLDLGSTARRYSATDKDLYVDYMLKGALSCADSSGIASKLASYYKGCPYAASTSWDTFSSPEDNYPDAYYDSDVDHLYVESIVVEARKLLPAN